MVHANRLSFTIFYHAFSASCSVWDLLSQLWSLQFWQGCCFSSNITSSLRWHHLKNPLIGEVPWMTGSSKMFMVTLNCHDFLIQPQDIVLELNTDLFCSELLITSWLEQADLENTVLLHCNSPLLFFINMVRFSTVRNLINQLMELQGNKKTFLESGLFS